MIIQNFSVDALKECSLWYLLKKQYGETVELFRPTASGNEPWTDFRAYRMFNGSTLIGFPNLTQTVFAQGLIAVSDGVTEHITTQAYERISSLVRATSDGVNNGTFSFVDSGPVPSSIAWRCDVEYYGPRPFPDLNGYMHNVVAEQGTLVAFEPIISIPGVGYVIYLQRRDFVAERNEFVNNALTPMTALTLGECFKLIHEWSVVAGEPFNNNEKIAVGAKKFCDALGITGELVSYYPDMQIARFLQGQPDARQRPENATPTHESLVAFVHYNTSHISLASILSMNPGVWDLQDIAELEQKSIVERKKDFFYKMLRIHPNEDFVIPPSVDKTVVDFVNNWLGFFDIAIMESAKFV